MACRLQDAVLHSSESSHYGWWITQPDTAPQVVVNCSAHDGLVTVWPLPEGTL